MKYQLEELFELQMGKTPSRNNPEYWASNDNKWISIADLSKCGKYISETKEYLSNKAVSETGIKQIPADTVVMSFKLSIGKTAITAEPMYSNEAIMSFRDKHVVKLLPEYVYYLLLAHDWNEGTNKAVLGKTLNKATLSKVKIAVHQYKEQMEMTERFDNFMYGLIISFIRGDSSFRTAKRKLCKLAELLEEKDSIPLIKDKLSRIKEIQTDAFWETENILEFEKVRSELRNLLKFLDLKHGKEVITRLTDPVTDEKENEPLEAAYDFEDYRAKVNRYICGHGDIPAIHKLNHNIKLDQEDYKELERIFTSELGSKEDYEKVYGGTTFGLLVRKIAKLDHEAAYEAFSAFINDQSLNQRQVAFINKIINHIEQNGYMESTDLQKPPFDRPVSFFKLFTPETRAALMQVIKDVKNNAIAV